MMAFGFELLHGIGCANGLSVLRLPRGELLLALLLFNVGIKIGQDVFVLLVVALRRSSQQLEIHWSVDAASARNRCRDSQGGLDPENHLGVTFCIWSMISTRFRSSHSPSAAKAAATWLVATSALLHLGGSALLLSTKMRAGADTDLLLAEPVPEAPTLSPQSPAHIPIAELGGPVEPSELTLTPSLAPGDGMERKEPITDSLVAGSEPRASGVGIWADSAWRASRTSPPMPRWAVPLPWRTARA